MSLISTAARYDITADQNGDYYQAFQWKIDGVPVDLSDYTAKMDVVDKGKSGFIYSLNTENYGISINSNVIVLTIPASALLLWPVLVCKYDLVLINPGGIVKPLIRGTFKLISGVTV